MNDEDLRQVVEDIQREERDLLNKVIQWGVMITYPSIHSLSERKDDAGRIQAELHARLGCTVHEAQAELLWKRFSAEQMLVPWCLVEEGNLNLCAAWVRRRQVS